MHSFGLGEGRKGEIRAWISPPENEENLREEIRALRRRYGAPESANPNDMCMLTSSSGALARDCRAAAEIPVKKHLSVFGANSTRRGKWRII